MENTATEKVKLTGVLSEFREALEDEIKEIEKSGQSSVLLTGGRRIASISPDFWYRFRIEYLPNMPSDTPCKLIIGKDSYDVTVISFEENSIIIASKVELPETLAKAKLDSGATVLLERLIARIEENAEKVNYAGERMLCTKRDLRLMHAYTSIFDSIDFSFNECITKNQREAIAGALTNDITYIWGPPGTGKTTVIGHIVYELLQRERSVLLVSHTNTAVDGAIKKVDDAYYKTVCGRFSESPYPILRLGKDDIFQSEERVTLKCHIKILGKELVSKKELLDQEKCIFLERTKQINKQINKAKWTLENHLSMAANLISEMYSLRHDLLQLDYERANISHELDRVKALSFTHQEYEALVETLAFKEKELNERKIQFEKTKSDLAFTVGKVQFIRDELVKHEKYMRLQTLASSQLSIPAQKEQIARLKNQVADSKNREHLLQTELNIYDKQVDEYNQKGAIARLLASKNLYLKALAKCEAIKKDLSEIKSLLEARIQTLKGFESQLVESLAIQEQIKAFTVNDTKENLLSKQGQMIVMAERLRTQLPVIEQEVEQCEAKLSRFRTSFAYSKELHDQLVIIEEKLAGIDSVIYEKQVLFAHTKIQCENEQEQDLIYCSSFGVAILETEIHAIHDALCKLLQEIELEAEGADIQGLESEKHEVDQKISEIQKELSEIDRKLQELEKQAILQAKVIGTTLVKSYLSDTLQERSFDTVILDEASMAPIPSLWCASYLAEKNIVIVGDFKQLPPIVMAETEMAQDWLGTDIFFQSGMVERLEKGKKPGNFISLNEQFRMEKEIAEIANMYYTEQGGRLISNDKAKDRIGERDKFYDWYAGEHKEHCVHLLDTKNLHAWVTGVPQGKRHSRLNCFSSALCVDLAFRLLDKKLNEYINSVMKSKSEKPYALIIAPYKPHITRIIQLVDLEYKARGIEEDPGFIHTGTIHSFQGNEADIVIFDLVIDEPHWKANLFLTDKEINDDLKRMFNVAVTRAKFKLFIIGNFAYCQKHAKGNALSQLLDYLINKMELPLDDAKKLFPKLTYAPPEIYVGSAWQDYPHIICKENSFFDYFINDIRKCKSQLMIYSPFITQDRLSTLLPHFADAINRGCSIVIVTKALADRGKSEIGSYQKYENEIRDLGIHIIHKKGMHEKLVFIDDTTVWMGSLNVLSFSGSTGEIMQRHYDKGLFDEYAKLFDIEHISEIISKPVVQKCPICGSEMIIAESDSGGFYWACVNKDYTRQPTQQYPLDGILMCRCGSPYKFVMKNQPRWVCSFNSNHFQRIRESDLKLDKMLALIPLNNRKEVVLYFSERKRKK